MGIYKPVRAFIFPFPYNYPQKQRKSLYGLYLAPCGSLDSSLLEVEIRIVFKLLLPFKLHSISEIYFIWHTKTSPGE